MPLKRARKQRRETDGTLPPSTSRLQLWAFRNLYRSTSDLTFEPLTQPTLSKPLDTNNMGAASAILLVLITIIRKSGRLANYAVDPMGRLQRLTASQCLLSASTRSRDVGWISLSTFA